MVLHYGAEEAVESGGHHRFHYDRRAPDPRHRLTAMTPPVEVPIRMKRSNTPAAFVNSATSAT
jgi:hypothetical protein